MTKFIITIIASSLASASPAIVASIRQAVQEMVERADKTANPWDDILCGMLQMLIGKPGSKAAGQDGD